MSLALVLSPGLEPRPPPNRGVLLYIRITLCGKGCHARNRNTLSYFYRIPHLVVFVNPIMGFIFSGLVSGPRMSNAPQSVDHGIKNLNETDERRERRIK